MIIKVPIKLINNATGIEKSLQLVADWVSISKPDKQTYKPDVGMCIFVMDEKKIDHKKEKEGH